MHGLRKQEIHKKKQQVFDPSNCEKLKDDLM